MTVHASGVWKTFGRFHALQDLNLTVPDGSAFALIGANGAGKTTTIKALMNIIQPTQGTITVLGVDSRQLSPRELSNIGYVSENQDMPARMTVGAFIAYLRPFYPNWDRTLEAETLRRLALPAHRTIKNLSHGMRLKLSLACALSFRPKLLVLDEPLGALDPLVRDEFIETLQTQVERTTILISSHELTEIETLTTHLAYIDRGAVLFQESLSDLQNRVRSVRVTLMTGEVESFVDTNFSEDELAARIEARFGQVRHIETSALPLRSMFTTVARDTRRDEVPL
jgi:ABC-type multidrug transport system ATPase subunit